MNNKVNIIGTQNINTAVGYAALQLDTTGAQNTAVGKNALQKVTTGSSNTANGYVAGYNITTGSYNTTIGQNVAPDLTTGGNAGSGGREYLAQGSQASRTRCIFAGGQGFPSPNNETNVVDYITFGSTGDASDFGDLTAATKDNAAASNCHGGLS